MPLSELRDPRSGFCVDEKVMISAKVKVEPQVNWWNWDSKKETGYVGLKNQGATVCRRVSNRVPANWWHQLARRR